MNDRATHRQHAYLQAMGVSLWELRSSRAKKNDSRVVTPPNSSTGATGGQVFEDGRLLGDWEKLQDLVRNCHRCALAEHRQHVVFGAGDHRARWLLVGEAPGAQEDKEGLPFVGRAGQLLNAMLFAMGLQRDEVYIANVLKCRPPGNRDPLGEECQQCMPYLHQQLRLLQPTIILAMGRFAAQALLKTTDPIGSLRGQQHVFAETGTPLLVTYHPAYLLRSPLQKRLVWSDLQLALSVEAGLR